MDSKSLRANMSNQALLNSEALGGVSAVPSARSLYTEGTSNDDLKRTAVVTNNNEQKLTKKQLISVSILCFVNLINYMDRFTVAGILSDVQCYYQIDDSQGGLIQTVFILAYMVFAPIFGYLGDRYSRKLIMAVGVAFWTLAALVSSFVPENHFMWFLTMRCLIGIGEASYSTIAPTIISDLFVSDLRSKMLALFYFAIPVGSGLGYVVGSLPKSAFGAEWQWGLRITPVVGTIATLLIIFVLVDPPRGQAEGNKMEATSYWEDIKSLARNPSYILSTAAFTAVAFVAGALAWWAPKYIALGKAVHTGDSSVDMGQGVFIYEQSTIAVACLLLACIPTATPSFVQEIRKPSFWVSFIFGVLAMLAGIIGVPFGSYASQKLRIKYPRADPLVCAFGLFVSAPLMLGVLLIAGVNTDVAFVLAFFGQVFLNLNWAIVADILLYVVVPTRRATAAAFQILISHALGDAGSPYFIGIMSEYLKPLPNSTSEVVLSTISTNGTTEWSAATTIIPPVANCSDSTLNPADFMPLQYSLWMCVGVELLGGILFVVAAMFLVKDKEKVDRVVATGSEQMTEESEALTGQRTPPSEEDGGITMIA